MNACLTPKSTVVGVDVHKYSHTAVAMNCFGQEKDRLDFSNDRLDDYVLWLQRLGQKEDIVVALEDVNGYGFHIVEKLSHEGIKMRYVPAILTERDRKQSIHREKSDKEDAKRVGKVILTKFEETLPAKESIANEAERNISANLDFLTSERRVLVSDKTILKNQLHAMLHQLFGDHYQDGFAKVFNRKAVSSYRKKLSSFKSANPIKSALAKSVIRRFDRLSLVEKQLQEIDKTINGLAKKSEAVMALKDNIHGCGAITGAAIIAEVTTIDRFSSKAKFARYSGIAPINKSSGMHQRLYTSPFGNRKMNRALHTIALCQIACRGDDRGKVYFQKKLSEGKTKLWALRCLKRQISNRVFQVLKEQKREETIMQ
ncbi:MAG: IS110 family transposase [Candidatus Berkelbacteria bacterium]|nr:IS110 family transposase [Candidatus Berkelbacteria bacterium]